MKYFVSACFFLLLTVTSFGQTDQEVQLATEYLEKGEYDKAITFFEKFYRYQPEKKEFYKNYLVCLVQTNDLKTAEKVIKKQVKEYPDVYSYKIDLGEFYRKSGDDKTANKEYQDIIKNLPASPQKIEELGSGLLLAGEVNYAIETYLKGKKLVPGIHSFNFKLAELYAIKGENQKMIDELMGVIAIDPSQESAVENILLTTLDDDPESELNLLVKSALLKEIQKNPEALVYSNMLIWMLEMQRNFEGAYIQAKALDKRLNENGDRMMRLGRNCLDNRAYETAVKCYETVIAKGSSSPYYLSARIELLNVLNKKITSDYTVDLNEVIKLEDNYKKTIEDIGVNFQSTWLMIELAHIQAFYLGKTTEAMKNLQAIVDGNRGKAEDLAKAKMELADIMVLTGEMWEPGLLYGQVEKDFKQDLLGQDAKFRNAKLSFYRGEFPWAQEQMKVLKASTSKLMANDALSLSLLILDNSGMDSSYDALMAYSRADLLVYQSRFQEALYILDSLEKNFPNHSLTDEVLFKRAEIHIRLGKHEDAVTDLEKIITTYGEDLLGDDALFKLADMQELHFKNTEKAMELYKTLLTQYPGSLYVVEARKRFRQLRGDKVN